MMAKAAAERALMAKAAAAKALMAKAHVGTVTATEATEMSRTAVPRAKARDTGLNGKDSLFGMTGLPPDTILSRRRTCTRKKARPRMFSATVLSKRRCPMVKNTTIISVNSDKLFAN